MGFKCGVVGLPNVGKSTLFNALTKTISAEAANYPFCTIEPNIGKVSVPDNRLKKIASIAKSQKTVPTTLEFVDIAGLVKGASKGEGLGNQFLANIREVDLIIYVLRCFEDENITHVEGNVDPKRDLEIIELELILSDLESLEKRLPNLEKKLRGNKDKEMSGQIDLIKKLIPHLSDEKPARALELIEEEKLILKNLNLLTGKKVIHVCNISEEDLPEGNSFSDEVLNLDKGAILICSKIEEEIAQLENEEEKCEFLETLGLEETGLNKIIKAGYNSLDLTTYFTAGVNEARAWTIKRGSKAPKAAGVIHTDFEKGFIKAETISYHDYIDCNGEQGARESGKLRLEGKDYIVKDGDVLHFKFNV